MKKNYLLLTLSILFTINIFAQTPEKLSYQAVVRDNSDNILSSQSIGMQLSILEDDANGNAVYVETQSPTTNINGLISLEIGMGSVISGDFTSIDWGNNTYFIKTEFDINGGTNYTITGTSQLLSVPYALYAKTSGSSTPGPAGADGIDGIDGIDGLDGATGPQGPAGLDGVDGIDGATGPQGAIGVTGATGANGIDGIDGLDGATGPMGPQGPAGLDGVDGIDGATGPQGAIGVTGATGANGIDGIDGLDGATGPMGPQGPAGLDGADGITGAQGPTGATGPAGSYTAGTGIDITSGVISSTGTSTMPEYAYAYIANSSTLGAQTFTTMPPSATYINGIVINGSSITLHANKMYEVTVAFYIYNATGGHTFKMKDATNSQYLGTEIYFGQGGSDVSYNMSMTNFLFKPTTDVILELEKTQGTDVNLIGKIVVKEIK
ncbi:hypothetical protein QLS71_017555 [Mariniflexile litorale]|uniref:Collagen triple helix repeat protein n=1 Tax=Mariniflexile litorale TaxID=3045158 RepID=A0AAU7EF90_9FLAO|nr:hypothetical protein [Mariniflexile sp. KMM 9835]MDQ8211654.1 hypothetical protein [Mariniflexile sp. KMM 9835]